MNHKSETLILHLSQQKSNDDTSTTFLLSRQQYLEGEDWKAVSRVTLVHRFWSRTPYFVPCRRISHL